MKEYKHIVFDVDGTLLDTRRMTIRSLQETLRERHHLEKSEAEMEFCLGIPGVDTLRRLGIEDVEGTLVQWLKNVEKYADLSKPFPGIPALLKALQQMGYRLGVVTSRTRRELTMDMKDRRFWNAFGAIVVADDTREHKPESAPLLCYLKRTEEKAEDVLYVGDTVNDFLCAQSAGVDFALAKWGALDAAVPCVTAPETPEELQAWLLRQQEISGKEKPQSSEQFPPRLL